MDVEQWVEVFPARLNGMIGHHLQSPLHKGITTQEASYRIVRKFATNERQKLARLLAREGQLWLLPMLDLIETGQVVVEQFIDVVGRAAIEAILVMNAEKTVGSWQQGKAKQQDSIYCVGGQPG